jgi:hypothetical protein
MSSTTNIQNLLVNVFRPSYQYRALPTPNYFVQLELSNVETVYANVIDSQNLRVSDTNSNVYVGREAGNSYLDLRDCFSNTTLGYGAGRLSSNTDLGIYIGFNAGTNASNASNVIAIGNNASGRGTSNIYIGHNTGGVDGETRNIFIGNDISSTGSVNDRLMIGDGLDPSGVLISADLSGRRVGLWTSYPTTYPIELMNYTYVYNGLGINASPLEHSLNVNGDCRMEDGFGEFTFDQDQTTSNSTMTYWSYTPGKVGLVQFGQGPTSNPVHFGMNRPGVDGGYTLDISGSLRVEDLSGNRLTVENGIVTSTSGYASIQGTTASLAAAATETVGQWKKGIVKIVTIGSSGAYHGGDWLFDGTTALNIASNATSTLVTQSTNDIVLSNSSGVQQAFGYNITYFPVP